MENKTIDPSTIPGWGMDADPKNEPTYPMKKYTGDDHNRINWARPPLQPETVEILKSTERPVLSAVFGTMLPPKGLSGSVRRVAFKYSENKYRHWLPLLMADRINAMEGYVEDIAKGHVPNVYKEMGWTAFAKHKPSLLVRKIAVRVVAVGLAVYLIRRAAKKRYLT